MKSKPSLFIETNYCHDASGISILKPCDVFNSFSILKAHNIKPTATILDPWYNKGFGGIREDYDEFVIKLLDEACDISEHVFLWGFPEIIARFVKEIPADFELITWLTWYYKNNPSVIRGWRSSQNACLHIGRKEARLYPQHFLNKIQLEKFEAGKLRYMPGPTSVIESALLIGFVGKEEQTKHPSQKPIPVYDKIIRMATAEGDLVFDPMAGSGTTGAVCKLRNRRAILGDMSQEYIDMSVTRMERLENDPMYVEKLIKKLDLANNNQDKGSQIEFEE